MEIRRHYPFCKVKMYADEQEQKKDEGILEQQKQEIERLKHFEMLYHIELARNRDRLIREHDNLEKKILRFKAEFADSFAKSRFVVRDNKDVNDVITNIIRGLEASAINDAFYANVLESIISGQISPRPIPDINMDEYKATMIDVLNEFIHKFYEYVTKGDLASMQLIRACMNNTIKYLPPC